MQFFYLIYLDNKEKYHKKRAKLLEHRCQRLDSRLRDLETQQDEQRALTESIFEQPDEDEIWADVIEDK